MRDSKADRLIRARTHAGYETAEAAAKAFGWEAPTYRSHEAGRRAYNDEHAATYGRAYKTPPEWLLYGRGAPKWAWVKVISFVGAGAEVHPESEPFDEIEPPPGASAAAFAVIVRGQSMAPAMADGDILVCQWVDDPASLLNRLALVDLSDGRRLVKKLMRGQTKGETTLIGLDSTIIENVQIARAAEVLWHKHR